MTAYVISEVEVLDEQAASQYRALAAESIALHGGKYLARAAEAIVAEGSPSSGRIVIVEFPSMQAARNWYASEEYGKALAFRTTALRRRLLFVEGLPQSGN
jgi:uncharacterized protein (DUF1330 family)